MPDQSQIGPHLLGRLPSPPDERDWRAENFLTLVTKPLVAGVDPVAEIDLAVKELKLTTVSFPKWAATKYADVTKTHWWQALNHLKLARDALAPPAPPQPPDPSVTVTWSNTNPTLDQGNTGHCVGFGAAQFGNTLPYDDQWNDSIGHQLYYECKVIDGEPGRENGSWVRSGAQALQNRTRIANYAWIDNVADAKLWVRTKGPIMIGTDWYNNMFDPDSRGFVRPTGGFAGGHAYLLLGDIPSENALLFLNSWGASWGDNGRFKISYPDFQNLLDAQGEACVALELPI